MKIQTLTKTQIDKFSEYISKWINIGLSTGKCDFENAKKAAIKCYKIAGLEEPKNFYVADCPISAAILAYRLKFPEKIKIDMNDKDVKQEIVNDIKTQIYGNMEASWLSFYDFFSQECDISLEQLDGLSEMSKYCGWWSAYKNIVIFQHKPKAIHLDNSSRIHNFDGPAIEYFGQGLSNVYAINGIRVTKKVIEGNFTCKDIDSESNVEVRRVMIQKYGQAKYLLDSNAKVVHQDDFGTLYRKEQENDEPIMMVKVVNSTPEADGSYKDYFLRVDPKVYGGLKTAHAAVASTWRRKDGSLVFENPNDYVCEMES